MAVISTTDKRMITLKFFLDGSLYLVFVNTAPQPVQNFAVLGFCLPHLVQKDIRIENGYCCLDLLFLTKTKIIITTATGNKTNNNSVVPKIPQKLIGP